MPRTLNLLYFLFRAKCPPFSHLSLCCFAFSKTFHSGSCWVGHKTPIPGKVKIYLKKHTGHFQDSIKMSEEVIDYAWYVMKMKNKDVSNGTPNAWSWLRSIYAISVSLKKIHCNLLRCSLLFFCVIANVFPQLFLSVFVLEYLKTEIGF